MKRTRAMARPVKGGRARKVAMFTLIGLAGLAQLAVHYLPMGLAAADASTQTRWLVQRLETLQPGDVDAQHLDEIRSHVARLAGDIAQVQHALKWDPLANLGRAVDPNGAVSDLDDLLSAGADLAGAAAIALELGDRLADLRSSSGSSGDQSLLAGIVGLIAGSTNEVATVRELVGSAEQSLERIPDTALGVVNDHSKPMLSTIARVAPLIDQYQVLNENLRPIFGWQGQTRYLVLAQDPAELRPSGGYIGTVGVVALTNAVLSERSFQDVYHLDLRPGVPFVQPPDELANHLLGAGSWQLADSNWSPDFPTAAQQALQSYTLESGDANIDGVIALTTFALDRILEVTGPIEVPEYGVTVHAGEVTLTALGLTRGISTPTSDRKAFLDDFASALLDRLFTLPADSWPALADAFKDIANERLMLVWFKDPGPQSLVAGAPLGGALRQDANDYLYVVESNVAPTSKYNLVVQRSDRLTVQLSPAGDATSTLQLDWQNNANLPGEPYEAIRAYSTSHTGLYGAYVRVYAPPTSSLVSSSGMATDPVERPETLGTEAGRTVFGNYLLMAPGSSHLEYSWQTPGAASTADGQWLYVLTVQRQPALGVTPLTVTVNLPPGAEVESLSSGATSNGNVVTLSTTPTTDVQLEVLYHLP